jgi:hypothetical protein
MFCGEKIIADAISWFDVCGVVSAGQSGVFFVKRVLPPGSPSALVMQEAIVCR